MIFDGGSGVVQIEGNVSNGGVRECPHGGLGQPDTEWQKSIIMTLFLDIGRMLPYIPAYGLPKI